MCAEWINDPQRFIIWSLANGWKPGLEIDKDIKAMEMGQKPDLYSPEYCQFVTVKINGNARKNNHYIEYNGKTQTLQQWSEEIGIFNETLRHRLRHLGWDIEKAFTTPVKKYATCK